MFELGKNALHKQSAYLKLKIEKEQAGKKNFGKDEELALAHAEWQQASEEYRALFEGDLDKNGN